LSYSMILSGMPFGLLMDHQPNPQGKPPWVSSPNPKHKLCFEPTEPTKQTTLSHFYICPLILIIKK
jgi:hypothetical protein